MERRAQNIYDGMVEERQNGLTDMNIPMKNPAEVLKWE